MTTETQIALNDDAVGLTEVVPEAPSVVGKPSGIVAFTKALLRYGRMEYWVFATSLVWVLLAISCFFMAAKVGVMARSLSNAAVFEKSLPSVVRTPVSAADLNRIAVELNGTFPGMSAKPVDGGVIEILVPNAANFHDWFYAVSSLLPSLKKGTSWSITTMCMAVERDQCVSGSAISVSLKGEALVLK